LNIPARLPSPTGAATVLDPVRIWRLAVRTEGDLDLPAFAGPLLRGVMGNALFARFGPAAAELFEAPNATAPFRLDMPLTHPRTVLAGKQWPLRLVTFRSDLEAPLLDAMEAALATGLRADRVPQAIMNTRTLRHGGERAPDGDPQLPPDLSARARQIVEAGLVVVRLASPTELKRRGDRIRRPCTSDVLHATVHRARALGLDVSEMPLFEDEAEELPGSFSTWRHERDSMAQGRRYDLVGEVGALAVRPTQAQAAWLALAEIIGVGASTAYGMGVVRVEPAAEFPQALDRRG
jgi:hypothetical protein